MVHPPDSPPLFACPVCGRRFRDSHGRGGHLATKQDAAHATHRAKHPKQPRPATPAPPRPKAEPEPVTDATAAESAPWTQPDAPPTEPAPLPAEAGPEPEPTAPPNPAEDSPVKVPPVLPAPSELEPDSLQSALQDYMGAWTDARAQEPEAFQSSLSHYTLAFGEAPEPRTGEAPEPSAEAEPPAPRSDGSGGMWALAGVIGTGWTLAKLVQSRKGANAPKPTNPTPRPSPAPAWDTDGADAAPWHPNGAATRRGFRGWPL